MPTMKMIWMPAAHAAFETILKQARNTDKYIEFVNAHDDVVRIVRDEILAFEKGELLYKTKKPGGEVRHLVHAGISICYAVFRDEKAGWITKYNAVKRAGRLCLIESRLTTPSFR